jgi:hypothetical protein
MDDGHLVNSRLGPEVRFELWEVLDKCIIKTFAIRLAVISELAPHCLQQATYIQRSDFAIHELILSRGPF